MQASEFGPGHWLAQTKLRPPPLRPDVIARPRLLGSLRSALLSARLTLVCAPAGYGKTTLLGALPAALPDLPLAWLSLDEEDGDPARFLTALVLALRQPFPSFGVAALSLLSGLPGPGLEPRYVVGSLVNELLEVAPRGCLLVLDDLHLISDPGAYLSLDYLLERMPPQVHVAIAARHDPPLALARLRARGHLAELRLADVRFTLEEAAELLNGRLRLGLGPGDLERLYELTEGWPVALRLLAGSLERIGSPAERSAFVAGLAQRDRHLFDYLAAEVLDRQEPAVRSFLLETSILEELTPETCRAVTSRDDAPRMLEGLDRRGLFLVAADGSGTILRYHALFGRFLQGRLERETPDRVAELHRRAAEASTTPGRKVAHFLAAGRWEEAATVVEGVAGPMLLDGQARTVAAWIDAMPIPALAGRSRLGLHRGVSALQQGDLPAARAHLQRAMDAFEEAGDEPGAVEALGYLATCALFQADFAAVGNTVERALRHPTSPHQRVQLLMTRCQVAAIHRDWAEVLRDVDGALAEVDATATREAVVALGLQLRLEIAALPGGLDRIERFVRRAVPVVGEGATPLGVALQEMVVFSHLWRGRLGEAIDVCERTLPDVRRLGRYPYLGLQAAGFGAVAHLARGEGAEAARLLDFVLEQLATYPLGQLYVAAPLYYRGKVCLAGGDLEGARRACQEIWAAAKDRESTEAETLRWKLRGCVAMAERRYREAERALREALAAEQRVPTAKLFGTARSLLARLAYEQHRLEATLSEIGPVLEECERQDTPGLILGDGQEVAPVLRLAVRRGVHAAFAERLLSDLGSEAPRGPATIPGTGEVLSPRELEILDLIVAGAGNRAIAERLVIGEVTVKSHVSSILRKLNVSSRTQAAARARELGLLREPIR